MKEAISSVEIVPHSGAIVISWWAEEYGNEWLESTTYYGCTKQEAIEAWKEQHGKSNRDTRGEAVGVARESKARD